MDVSDLAFNSKIKHQLLVTCPRSQESWSVSTCSGFLMYFKEEEEIPKQDEEGVAEKKYRDCRKKKIEYAIVTKRGQDLQKQEFAVPCRWCGLVWCMCSFSFVNLRLSLPVSFGESTKV